MLHLIGASHFPFIEFCYIGMPTLKVAKLLWARAQYLDFLPCNENANYMSVIKQLLG